MNYYSDTNDDSGNVSGTFEFSSHTVKLSDSSDLAYAVIDMTPFMFTIWFFRKFNLLRFNL